MTVTLSRRGLGPLAAAIAAAPVLVQAQTAPAPAPALPGGRTITYLEIAPASVDDVMRLLRAEVAATRADLGNEEAVLLRRIDRPHHFAIVERWRDEAAAEAHRASARVAAFRAALAGALIAPYDERPHSPLSVGAANTAPNAIVAVTHVDIIPPMREVGTARIEKLANDSRGAPGNLRFDALIQNSRPNHFTLVEVWADEPSLLAHAGVAHLRAFRGELLPMSGSLFDERLYRVVS
ncbi:putative quinol monooxygenase [Humitalea sp. 24SJ18S-53]|uniref:putative quinol monooxygenase n=1 Tax=Humitalea sp. 24SJ18S-53 TaxID=3422307 RepID=UPI003D673E23